MNILRGYQMIGFNHQQADYHIRGAVSLHGERKNAFYRLACGIGLSGFILSTCNRTEIYFNGTSSTRVSELWQSICPEVNFPNGIMVHHHGREMLTHLYEVACGLDAKVPGDNEILGQLKEAAQEARRAGTLDGIWQRITNSAIACSRKIRNSTNFNLGTTSIPYTISQKIREISGNTPRILVMGTGAMALLCIKYLNKHLPGRHLTVASRCPEKARRIAAETGGRSSLLPDPGTSLTRYDAVISALQLDQPVFHLPEGHTLIFDLGIPANFIASPHTRGYKHLDVLAAGVKITLGCRKTEVHKVELIIADFIQAWADWEEKRARITGSQNRVSCSLSA